MTKPAQPTQFVAGMDRLGSIIADHFKIICTRQTIHFWRSKEPPFPSPKNSNRFHLQDCLDWVEEHVMVKKAGGNESQQLLTQLAYEAKQKQIIREDEEHKFGYEKLRGLHIELAVAERSIVGMSKSIFAWVRNEVERNATTERKLKLAELGATPEIVAAFYEFDIKHGQAMIDAIATVAAKAAQEGVDAIKP